MLKIRKKEKATLSNILNEMVCKGLTLQQLRFFLVYLAKLNPKDPSKTEVTFSLREYQDIIGVELNESNIDKVTEDLMKMIVNIRPAELRENELEAVIKCPLFSECRLYKEKSDGQYYLTFECHKRTKDEIFNLAKNFTSIEVWNVLNLHSFIDSRIYMLLKQYKTVGKRVIGLKELKQMIGIDKDSYQEYKIFSRDVLKKAQKSLKEKTDICFEYKSIGRPAHSVEFEIKENKEYTLPKFLINKDAADVFGGDSEGVQMDVYDFPELIPEQSVEKTTITDKREKELIENTRSHVNDVNSAWNITDAQILELHVMLHNHLCTIVPHMALDKDYRELKKWDFVDAMLLRARSEGAKYLYKYLVSQWDRYKNEIWVWN